MAKKKRRRLKKSFVLYMILFMSITGIIVLLTVNFSFVGKRSVHGDAKKYSTRHCLAFYPDSGDGRSYAKELCKLSKEDKIYDYSLVPYGDYYLIDYGNLEYFVDKSFNKLEIKEISDEGRIIIADYLRYAMKKNHPEKYYNVSFMEKSSLDNLSFDGVTYDIEGESLKCRFEEFDLDVMVPLKYMQKQMDMFFGYENEDYHKPQYLDRDPSHPVICLTFDDGPQLWAPKDESSTARIIDTLYRYDAVGTFYVVGDCLEERSYFTDAQLIGMLKDSIRQGNEYGSHTQTHKTYLTDFAYADDLKKEIDGPCTYLSGKLGYRMKTYRPIGGVFDDNVLSAQNLPAILWDVDSGDWEAETADEIYDQVMKYAYEDGDIIIFHDIYSTTAEAIERLLPALIEKGCQFATISEMLAYQGIDESKLSYYYNPGYFE